MSAAVSRAPHSRISALLLFLGVPAMPLTYAALNVLEIHDGGVVAREKEFRRTSLMRRLTAPARDGKPRDLSQIYLAAETTTLDVGEDTVAPKGRWLQSLHPESRVLFRKRCFPHAHYDRPNGDGLVGERKGDH